MLDLDEFDRLVSSLNAKATRQEKIQMFIETQQDTSDGVITPEVWVRTALECKLDPFAKNRSLRSRLAARLGLTEKA